jgi:hypothetical protein
MRPDTRPVNERADRVGSKSTIRFAAFLPRFGLSLIGHVTPSTAECNGTSRQFRLVKTRRPSPLPFVNQMPEAVAVVEYAPRKCLIDIDKLKTLFPAKKIAAGRQGIL